MLCSPDPADTQHCVPVWWLQAELVVDNLQPAILKGLLGSGSTCLIGLLGDLWLSNVLKRIIVGDHIQVPVFM